MIKDSFKKLIIIINNNKKKYGNINIFLIIKNNYTNLDNKTKSILKKGLIFCLFLGLLGLYILATYSFKIANPILFSIGFILFKLSLTFGVEFIICGFAVDKIKKELI